MSKFLAICILAAIIVFVVGGGIAFYLYGTKTPQQKITSNLPQTNTPNVFEQTIKNLSSGVIVSSLAYGQITNVSGKNLTLTNGGDILTVPFSDSAKIYTAGNKEINFSDLKTGTNLSVNIKILPDGSIQAMSAFVSGIQN